MSGHLRTSIFPTRPLIWHTLTCWTDEASMRAFVRAPAHREAMAHTGELATESRFARFETDVAPDKVRWRDAFRALREAG